MGSIRDKAQKGRKNASSKAPTPAKEEPKAEPKAEPKPSAVAVEDPPAPEKVASVTSIASAEVDRLSDREVETFLARQASRPGVAGLVATRETKRNQIQYDGETADGFIVRVWAPEGSPMVVKASLEIVE